MVKLEADGKADLVEKRDKQLDQHRQAEIVTTITYGACPLRLNNSGLAPPLPMAVL
jgi:hypothetical protein